MIEVFAHVPEKAVVWANDSRVYQILKTLKVGREVCLCGKDGWPEHHEPDTLLVRLVNTPPPVPVSTFQWGEIVVSPEQIKMFWLEEAMMPC